MSSTRCGRTATTGQAATSSKQRGCANTSMPPTPCDTGQPPRCKNARRARILSLQLAGRVVQALDLAAPFARPGVAARAAHDPTRPVFHFEHHAPQRANYQQVDVAPQTGQHEPAEHPTTSRETPHQVVAHGHLRLLAGEQGAGVALIHGARSTPPRPIGADGGRTVATRRVPLREVARSLSAGAVGSAGAALLSAPAWRR